MWMVEWSDTVPLDWTKHGDEWVSHLKRLMRESVNASFRMSTSAPDEVAAYYRVELDPQAEGLCGRLWLIPRDGRFALQLVAEDAPDDEELDLWIRATQSAIEAVGKAHEVFEWCAVVGPPPGTVGRPPQTLAIPFDIGGLHVAPAGVDLLENAPSVDPSLNGHRIQLTRPLLVTGSSKGYEWDAARGTAARLLARLCALLTLAWDDNWLIREDPRPVDWGISVPTSPAWLRGAEWLRSVDHASRGGEAVEPPDWLGSGWDITSSDAVLEDALLVHAEGVRLHHAHPSFALTAFVASIEAVVGARLDKPEQCSSCNQIKGSTQRFKKALALCVNEATAKRLEGVYGQRSGTVHRGRLHGAESVGGLFFMSGFFEMLGGSGPDPFRWQTVLELRQASRESLIRAFTGFPNRQEPDPVA